MNDFKRSNKVSGVKWLKKNVKYLKIKIKLKTQDGIIALPKFDEYSEGTNSLKLESLPEEYNFKWQEKIFCPWEVQRYSDKNNCITDTELSYHDMVENLHYTPTKIYTYIHEDNYLPLPLECKINKDSGLMNLDSYLEWLTLNETLGGIGRMFGAVQNSTSVSHLFRSEEDLSKEEMWTAMHVMLDNSDYIDDGQLLFKHEETLLSLYYNTSQNYLIITPDVNDLELNPYTLEVVNRGMVYQYGVDMEFEEGDAEELVILLKKSLKRWEKKHKHLLPFVMPPLGKKQYYVVLEILSAAGFDMDNLYVDFNVKTPEDVNSNDKLSGKSHTSKSHFVNDCKHWNFGHILEFTVELNSEIEPQPLKLFLEVISTDWWGRHRTEGYTYSPIRLDPGFYTKKLSCSRPQEINEVKAESRRFFLGGCHLVKDLNVLAEPQLQDANFTYISTGTILLRWNVIKHQCIGVPTTEYISYGGASTASALLLGADTALSRYSKARTKLAQATRLVSGS